MCASQGAHCALYDSREAAGLRLRIIRLASPSLPLPTGRIDGHPRSSRSHGRRGAAAVGAAHGAVRHPARLRLRPPLFPGEGAGQPLLGIRRRARTDRAPPVVDRDRADDRVVRGAGTGGAGAGARDHARRQCRHDADRPAARLQRRGDRAGAVRHRPRRLPRRRRHARARSRPHRHRLRTGAAGAAHHHRPAGAGGERAGRARAARCDHRRSHHGDIGRGDLHLGGAFERRCRAADHVAGIFAFRDGGGGAGDGARRQPRLGHQPDTGRRQARRPGELSPARRQPGQPAGRHRARGAVPGTHHRRVHRVRAGRRADDGVLPHRLQPRADGAVHRSARSVRRAARPSIPGEAEGRRSDGAALP